MFAHNLVHAGKEELIKVIQAQTYTVIYRSRKFQESGPNSGNSFIRTLSMAIGYVDKQQYEKLNPQTGLVEKLPALVWTIFR